MTFDDLRYKLYKLQHPKCSPCDLDKVYPPTRDGAARALPLGWSWERSGEQWRAWNRRGDAVQVLDTGNEVRDRYRLAYEATKAMGGGS